MQSTIGYSGFARMGFILYNEKHAMITCQGDKHNASGKTQKKDVRVS
jgi:hypothetical protein